MALSSAKFIALCALLLCIIMTVSAGEEEKCVFPTNNVPYITFMGQRLPDHSYLDIAQLQQNSTLECHTDRPTCCDPTTDIHTGEWVLPNGEPAKSFDQEFRVSSSSQRIDLVYKGSPATTGIFRCNVPTNDVHDTGNTARESVYIGIYASDGLYIDGADLTINSDLNGPKPQFTITCYSAGGPVGCVVWRRQKVIITNPNATSVLMDAADGYYEHNLTVTGNFGGSYSCSVANNKPASKYEGVYIDNAEIPLNLSVIQVGPTSLHIYWVKPFIKKTTGYRIYYSGASSGYIDVDDPLVDNLLLTGLKNNASYNISIIGKSRHLPSERLSTSAPIQLVPGVPELRLFSATDNTLSVSWTLPNGSRVDRFEILWDRYVGSTSASFRDSLSSSTNSYTVTGLKGYNNATFSVSVTAFNAAGSATSSRMNVASNFASGNIKSEPSSSSGSNDEATIGAVVAGFVILAIAVVVVALLVYHYKYKSKKSKPQAVYSLAGPAATGSASRSQTPTAPPTRPPPRPAIRVVNNGSYTPTVVNDVETGTYYTPMAYTYPNMGPESQSNTNNNTTADTTGHGYEYIK